MNCCTVRIETDSEGEISVFHAKGTLERKGNGVRVCYEQDGDEVSLLFDERTFLMQRTGASALNAAFCEGEWSHLTLDLGDNRGEIPLRTSEYYLKIAPTSFQITLRYELLFGKSSKPFHLHIRIQTEKL